MADSKNDSKEIQTTEDTPKTNTTEDLATIEKLHRPQSFQRLPSPSESDTGQQESDNSTSKPDPTSNDSSTSKPNPMSNDSSSDTDKK